MERVLANKANYLVTQGHEVAIVTTDQRDQRPFFPMDERIRCYDLGINYEENNGKSFFNKLIHYPFKQWTHKKRLSQLLKELKADIVISMFCNDASFLPDIEDGSKKVLEIHFSRFKRLQYNRKGIWRLADWWRYINDEKIASRFDRFIVLTEEDKRYWKNVPNIKVIYNARTFSEVKPASLKSKKILAVGRLNHQKGFDRLIWAWKIICEDVQGWTLEIVGDGELRHDLLKLIERLGLSDRIVLRKAEKNMLPIYQSASIFAMSSYYEGLPMVLLEAQAIGLPIVSFACKCGPKDIISDGVDGFLVPEGNVDLLAQKLLLLMNNESLRECMGREAFKNSEKFAESAVMSKWMALFNELIKE